MLSWMQRDAPCPCEWCEHTGLPLSQQYENHTWYQLTGTFFCVTTTAQSFPLTATDVSPPWLMALKAYSGKQTGVQAYMFISQWYWTSQLMAMNKDSTLCLCAVNIQTDSSAGNLRQKQVMSCSDVIRLVLWQWIIDHYLKMLQLCDV